MKARTTKALISTARGLLGKEAAMIAPCSVNGHGKDRRPPLSDLRSQIVISSSPPPHPTE